MAHNCESIKTDIRLMSLCVLGIANLHADLSTVTDFLISAGLLILLLIRFLSFFPVRLTGIDTLSCICFCRVCFFLSVYLGGGGGGGGIPSYQNPVMATDKGLSFIFVSCKTS